MIFKIPRTKQRKKICDAARITITRGNPATKNPNVDPITTQAADLRDKNIAKKIGT